VSYAAVADPDGAIDSTSLGRTNFWDFAPALFDVGLPVDRGLAGAAMPGPRSASKRVRHRPRQPGHRGWDRCRREHGSACVRLV